MDRLHKSLDRKLLNKVAQALDQIRELDDVVFDANRNQNTPGKSISIEEIALYEEMLISQKIIPKDKRPNFSKIGLSENKLINLSFEIGNYSKEYQDNNIKSK